MRGHIMMPPAMGINRKWQITLELEEEPTFYDRLKDKEISVEIKQYKEKRSLNANAYFHVLVDKIAGKQRLTHTEVHNRLIADYGFMDEQINNIILDDSIPWLRLETIHLRPTTATRVMDNGKLYRVYLVMRGSHTYDTAEMSRLIDGTVEEAKALDIETLTNDELERMKSLWMNSGDK